MRQNSKAPWSAPACEPESDGRETDSLPLSDGAREGLLRRLETWIEEEERLVAEIERRIAAAGAVAPFPARPDHASPRARDGKECAEMQAATSG